MNLLHSQSTNAVFARIQNDEIVEYPVSLLHITNRAHPIDWYVECIFDTKPTIPAFHYAVEVPVIEDNKVRVSYNVIAYTLEQLLNMNKSESVGFPNKAPVAIADVEPALLQRIVSLTTAYVQDKLDTFAQEKGYDSLLSATSYKDSQVSQFVTDALKAIVARDNMWTCLHDYLNNVNAGSDPVPVTFTDITSRLPILSWV